MSNENRRITGWTINKEISIGDLIAIVMATTGILIAWFNVDKRVTVLETTQVTQQTNARNETEDIKSSVLRLEAKVDTLLQRK